MPFDNDKLVILQKKDKSKKGSVDRPIQKLIDFINKERDFYTTSSCSGRIIVLTSPPPGKKHEAVWLYVSHEKADYHALSKSLKKLPKAQLWLKMESFILHLRAREESGAEKILALAKKAGFKHTGIISLGSKIVLEIFGADRLDVPIAQDGRLLISDGYLEYIVGIANDKLEANHARIGLFYRLLLENL